MEKSNLTTNELAALTAAHALKNAIKGLSLVESLKEELADFISKSTNEPKEEIIKRIDSREKEIRQNLSKSTLDNIGILDELESHKQ